MSIKPIAKDVAVEVPRKSTSKLAMKSTPQNSESTETKSSRTRQRILIETARLFANQGYFFTNIRDIARESGIRSGAIYYYFESKEELAWAVVDRGVTEVYRRAKESVDNLGNQADPIDAIIAAFNAHLTYIIEEENFAFVAMRRKGQLPSSITNRLLEKEKRIGAYYAELFRKARDEGYIAEEFNISALRMLFAGALNWVPEWYDARGLSPRELVDQLESMMRGGLKASPLTVSPNG